MQHALASYFDACRPVPDVVPAPRLVCRHCGDRPVAVVSIILHPGSEPHADTLCGSHAVTLWDGLPRAMRHSFKCLDFEA